MTASRIGLALSLVLAAGGAVAAEGMWTLENLPRAALAERHGFEPDQRWIEQARQGAVRIAGGCSASFVSPDGLVLTNHHCILGCLNDLSRADDNVLANGFVAAQRSDERICPGMELNRLDAVSDVTARIGAAIAGLEGQDYADAKQAEQSRIESECVGKEAARVRCDVVELYQGAVQHLYRYTRYADARLVFAPEYAMGFFGGDPDNFNFPRYALDMALLRAWDGERPARVRHWFPLDPGGAEPGELVMTLGNPGTTQRLLTVAQLSTQRDVVLPFRLLFGAEQRGLLARYSAEDPEQARQAQTDLFGVENGLKARRGQLQALLDPAVLDRHRREEAALREFVAADAARAERIGDPWREIASAQETWRSLYLPHALIEQRLGLQSLAYGHAVTLLRGAAERALPNAERLREFNDSALPLTERTLLAARPIHAAYEQVELAWSLTKLREWLGADHALVRTLFASESPEALAARVVAGTRLADPAVRKALWQGGAEAVAASRDPMLELARQVDPTARALRMRYEAEVEAVERRAAERLAAARFERSGTGVYPDATFSLRLSYGEIVGWREGEAEVPPYTTIAGLYARHTGYAPFALPARWLAARERLDPATRFNQVSRNDIIGGNSGSPLVDRELKVVGLIFDGNTHSLGGAYAYDATRNRAVSVHPAAMLAALEEVYDAGHLAAELRGQRARR